MPRTNANGHTNGHTPVNRIAAVVPPPAAATPAAATPATATPAAPTPAAPTPAAPSQRYSYGRPDPTPGRGSGGRFAKENKYGGGNPYARRVAGLRAAFLDAVSEAEVAELAKALLKKALDGDSAAAHLFLSYALGKPVAVRDPDMLDLDELALLLKRPDFEAAAHFLSLPPTIEHLKSRLKSQREFERAGDDDEEDDEDGPDADDIGEQIKRLDAMMKSEEAKKGRPK